MLIKRTERQARRGTLAGALQGQVNGGLDRRAFLRRSGLVAGGLATLGALPLFPLAAFAWFTCHDPVPIPVRASVRS